MEISTIEGRKPISVIREEVKEKFDPIYDDPLRREEAISSEVFFRLYPDQITIELVTNMLQNSVNYYKQQYEDEGNERYKKYEEMYEKSKGEPFYESGHPRHSDKMFLDRFQKALSGATGEGPVSDVVIYLNQEAFYFSNKSKEALYDNESANFFGSLAPEMGVEGKKQYFGHIAKNYETAAKLFENHQKMSFVVGEENQTG